jgi:hypothetical protein
MNEQPHQGASCAPLIEDKSEAGRRQRTARFNFKNSLGQAFVDRLSKKKVLR